METEIAEAEEALRNFQTVRQNIEEQAQTVLDEVKKLTVSAVVTLDTKWILFFTSGVYIVFL